MQTNDSNEENYEVILVLMINPRDQKHIFIYRFPTKCKYIKP